MRFQLFKYHEKYPFQSKSRLHIKGSRFKGSPIKASPPKGPQKKGLPASLVYFQAVPQYSQSVPLGTLWMYTSLECTPNKKVTWGWGTVWYVHQQGYPTWGEGMEPPPHQGLKVCKFFAWPPIRMMFSGHFRPLFGHFMSISFRHPIKLKRKLWHP